MPDTELLTDQQITEIETAQVKRRESLAFHQGEYPSLPTPPYIAEIDALIATVKQLRGMVYLPKILSDDDDVTYERLSGRLLREKIDLQSQLEQLRAENEQLKQHVADLNHDLDAAVKECNEHHG